MHTIVRYCYVLQSSTDDYLRACQVIARDLWAMFVSLTNLEAEPFKNGEEELSEPSSPEKSSRHEPDPLQKIYDALSDSEDEGMPSGSHTFGGLSTETQDIDGHTAFPNGMEDHETQEIHTGQRFRGKRRSVPGRPFNPAHRLRLQYTLVVCYLSCLTLRIPILMKDILE